MKNRFITFVDGSNLYGTLRKVGLRVSDFEGLYRYVFERAVDRWQSAWYPSMDVPAHHVRVYWYVVASIDDWDLANPRTLDHLRERFFSDTELTRLWTDKIQRHGHGRMDHGSLEVEAFNHWLSEFTRWYDGKCSTLDGMLRFYHGVESSTEFIEFRRCGRWKVDTNFSLAEKGVDTSLAVDMVGMAGNYDVAILISDDADSIPSLRYLKESGKHVGVVEFLPGFPPDSRSRGPSSRVKLAADFVIQAYEQQIIDLGIATRMDSSDFDPVG